MSVSSSISVVMKSIEPCSILSTCSFRSPHLGLSMPYLWIWFIMWWISIMGHDSWLKFSDLSLDALPPLQGLEEAHFSLRKVSSGQGIRIGFGMTWWWHLPFHMFLGCSGNKIKKHAFSPVAISSRVWIDCPTNIPRLTSHLERYDVVDAV